MVGIDMPGAPRPDFGRQGAQPAAWVVPLTRLTREDRPTAGGKAVNLGEMLRAGLPVPEGFCVTTVAFRLWLDGSRTADSLLDRLDDCATEPEQRIREAAASLRQALTGLPFPSPGEQAIRAALAQHGPQLCWVDGNRGTVTMLD